MLCAWRLLRGPEITDRLLALDTLYINAVALVISLGMKLRSDLLFEAALIIAMLGFGAHRGAGALCQPWRRHRMRSKSA